MFSSFKGEKKIHQKILKYNRGKSSFYKAMGKKKMQDGMKDKSLLQPQVSLVEIKPLCIC